MFYLSKEITHRRRKRSLFFFFANFRTLLLRVSVRNNLEYTSSPVWATHPDCSRRHRRVSGPEFQFRQIKACRFRTFSRLAERRWECIRPSPAPWNFPRIPETLLCPVCHLLDDDLDTFLKKKKKEKKKTTPKNIEDMLGVISSIRTNLPNPSVCSVFPFFSRTPRALKSSKSTRGADKLGQLLHRLVSKLRDGSVCGFSLVI